MKVSERRIRRLHRGRARADGFSAAFEVQPQHQEAPRTVQRRRGVVKCNACGTRCKARFCMVAIAQLFGTDLFPFMGVVQLQGRWQTLVHVCEVVDEVRCA